MANVSTVSAKLLAQEVSNILSMILQDHWYKSWLEGKGFQQLSVHHIVKDFYVDSVRKAIHWRCMYYMVSFKFIAPSISRPRGSTDDYKTSPPLPSPDRHMKITQYTRGVLVGASHLLLENVCLKLPISRLHISHRNPHKRSRWRINHFFPRTFRFFVHFQNYFLQCSF